MSRSGSPPTPTTADPASTTPADPAWSGSMSPGGRRRFLWLIALVWLFFLGQPALRAWHQPGALRWAALAAVIAFAALFVSSFVYARAARLAGTQPTPGPAIVITVAGLALSGLLVALIGGPAMALLVYVGVMAVFLLPGRWGPVTVAALIATSYLAERLVLGASHDLSTQVAILLAAVAMGGVRQVITRNAELAAARTELTRLAVAEERNRFARDLHDILGHSLTVVAVKAELAGRLVRLDPERAEQEIAEVERLARDALSDVRASLSGRREVSLSGELANARAALAAAGIEAELPGVLDGVPVDRRELFGWVVREGVTNVVRHSGASRCRVEVTARQVRITDDGHGPSHVDGRNGVGLTGLRERVAAQGGSVRIGRLPAGGFELKVSL